MTDEGLDPEETAYCFQHGSFYSGLARCPYCIPPDPIEKVLAESTPRPWITGPHPAINGIYTDLTDADCALIGIAVNSYEAAQERIRVLTEALRAYWEDLGTLFKALTEARVYLATPDYHAGKNEIVKQLLIKIDATLSQDKEVQP